VEVVRSAALLRAEAEAALQQEREHVCPYLYGHGELFLLHRPLAPLPWRRPGIRLTVDTEDDYQYAARLWETLSRRGGPAVWTGEAIIAAVEAQGIV
jgi:spore coat polysaccharide biosynthesis protein SpsF